MNDLKAGKRIKRWFSSISFRNLNRQIRGYGYEYSLKRYLAQIVMTLAAIVTVSYFYLLAPSKILLIGLLAVCVFPIIVLAQFRYLAGNDRFEQMVNYMDQMILSFKQTPKILFAMESTLDLIDGTMKTCVTSAIRIIKTDASGQQVYEKAFQVIEEEFPCSRLATLHRFLLNVEKENSTHYQESIDNLYFDIRSWVTRTYQYQAELSDTKKKIVVILGLSLAIAAVFSHTLKSAEEQIAGLYPFHILESNSYQIATTLYLAAFILIYAFLSSKITGQWLIDDLLNKNEARIVTYMDSLAAYDKKLERKQAGIAALFSLTLFFAGVLLKSQAAILIGVGTTLFILLKGNLNYNRRKKAVEKELLKEFPVWMRDIAINLNNMIVVRAVEQSYDKASKVMQAFLDRFLKAVERDPNSIAPYIHFLGIYNVSELSTALKTLYAIRTLSTEDSQRQVNDLIVRNQTLLEASERLRNQDSLVGVSFVSMLPMVLLSLKLIVDLGLMLTAFLSLGSF